MRHLLTILSCCLCLMAPAAEDAHEGHDHAAHGHADEGPEQALGTLSLDGRRYALTLHGGITAGEAAVLSIAAAEADRHAAEIRVWVGRKNGRGSVKALLKADEHGHYHGHLEVPAALADGAALWCEVRTDEGGRDRQSLALPEAKQHADDETHEHDEAEEHDEVEEHGETDEHEEADEPDHEEHSEHDGHDH